MNYKNNNHKKFHKNRHFSCLLNSFEENIINFNTF